MFTQHSPQRKTHRLLLARAQGEEHRCFTEPAAQPHTHHTEHPTQQERVAPGVIEDFLRGEQLRQQGGGQRPQQVAESQPGLQKAQGITAPPVGRVLGNERPGAWHFTAYGSPLEDAQGQQDQRGGIADVGIGRHHPDQQTRQGHHQDAQAEYPLAPQVVGEVRHQDAAQRPRQIAGDEDSEALQQAQPFGHLGREEQLAEGQREEHENDEVVDFQRATQRRQAQGPMVAAAEPGRASGIDGSHGRVRRSAKGKSITNSCPIAPPVVPLAVEHRMRKVGSRPWPRCTGRQGARQR
ncbi:hypothetical protein D9M71_358800 [compost metagenome]